MIHNEVTRDHSESCSFSKRSVVDGHVVELGVDNTYYTSGAHWHRLFPDLHSSHANEESTEVAIAS